MAQTDILGPASAVNAVTVRPGDDRTFTALDSWFKDCSAPDVNDGTKLRAAFFNGVLAQMRGAMRGNGLTVGGAQIVPDNNADDFMFLKAIQHLIQRGQVVAATDTGTANHLSVALSPTPPEYKFGMTIRVKVAFANSGAADITVSGLGTVAIKRTNLTALAPGELGPGMIAELVFDGSVFQLVGTQPNILVAPRTYYVNAGSGNDGNDGLTAGTAFATIQRALTAAGQYNQNGFTVTIAIAAGNYSAAGGVSCGAINGTGAIILQCAAGVSITAPSGSAIKVFGRNYVLLGNPTITAPVAIPGDPGFGIWSVGGAIGVADCTFGACAGGHMAASAGAANTIDGPITINGPAPVHMVADANSSILLNLITPPALTLVGTPNFSSAFAVSERVSVIEGHYSSITGAATGVRYNAMSNSIVDAYGAGATAYPGNVLGVTSTGGNFVP
jgi:hypothetical protein